MERFAGKLPLRLLVSRDSLRQLPLYCPRRHVARREALGGRAVSARVIDRLKIEQIEIRRGRPLCNRREFRARRAFDHSRECSSVSDS